MYYISNYGFADPDYLEHYGIKGMKWGAHKSRTRRLKMVRNANKRRNNSNERDRDDRDRNPFDSDSIIDNIKPKNPPSRNPSITDDEARERRRRRYLTGHVRPRKPNDEFNRRATTGNSSVDFNNQKGMDKRIRDRDIINARRAQDNKKEEIKRKRQDSELAAEVYRRNIDDNRAAEARHVHNRRRKKK